MMRVGERAHARYGNTGLHARKEYYKQLKHLVTEAMCMEKRAFFDHLVNYHLGSDSTPCEKF